jgi:hypothetical protein
MLKSEPAPRSNNRKDNRIPDNMHSRYRLSPGGISATAIAAVAGIDVASAISAADGIAAFSAASAFGGIAVSYAVSAVLTAASVHSAFVAFFSPCNDKLFQSAGARLFVCR